MDPVPATISVHRPLQAPSGGGDQVLADVVTRFRRALDGEAPPRPMGPAILAARREAVMDRAAGLDDALLEVAVAAMFTMARTREAYPEIAHRHKR